MNTLHTVSGICARIFELPGREPFMIAADLAEVYGTSVKRIGQAVSRNPDRFPDDFMFVLTHAETEVLRSQNVTANAISTEARTAALRSQNATANMISTKVRYDPVVFTHAGAYALSAVLKTPVAAKVSVIVYRAFAAMERRALEETKFLLIKLRREAAEEKPVRRAIVDGVRHGLTFEAIWRLGNYSRPRLALAARDCLALGLIDILPAGTPDLQLDLFAAGVAMGAEER